MKRLLYSITGCLGILLGLYIFTSAQTQVNWYTQLTYKPVIDARTYGVRCDGSTSDSTAMQLAIDAVPTSNGGTSQPVVVQMPAGNCIITATVLLRRAGVIIQGYGWQQYVCTNSSCGTFASDAQTILTASSTFDGPFIRADAADVTVPAVTTQLRGVGVRNLSFDNTAAVANNHFLSAYQLDTRSLSNPYPFENLVFRGFVGGAFLAQSSLTSTSTYAVNPYPTEYLVLRNFQMQSAGGNFPTSAAIKLVGVNQTVIRDGRITGPSPTVLNNIFDVAAIEIDSDNYALLGGGILLDNIAGQGYAVWTRIRGADQSKVPCSTPPISGGCNVVTPYHGAPNGITITHGFVEGFNRGIVVGEETNSSGGIRQATSDLHVDNTNRWESVYGLFFKVGQLDWMSGGEVSLGITEFTIPIIVGSNTSNIVNRVPYNLNYAGNFPVTYSNALNKPMADSGAIPFASLPTTNCYGLQLVCTDCSCASGGTCSGGGVSYRGVVKNASGTWVGL